MFRTEIHPQKPDFSLQLQDPVLTVGSCFSEVIGQRLREAKFQSLVNPFGTIFHPGIAAQLLVAALQNQPPAADTFLCVQERWLSYLLHSSVHAPDQESLEKLLSDLFSRVHQQLQQAKVLMLTAGSAYLYVHEQLQLPVANCHKQAQKQFSKKLSSVEEITTQLESLYLTLKKSNPELRLILTLSPVRHLKDSLVLNSVSKSSLRLALHQLCEKHQDITYFPSYELLLDDLRDYRFFANDLLHPSEMAEEYIWQKFIDTFFSEEARSFLKEWQPLRHALQHRPFNPSSRAHQQFLRKTIHKLTSLSYGVDVSSEIAQLKSQLL